MASQATFVSPPHDRNPPEAGECNIACIYWQATHAAKLREQKLTLPLSSPMKCSPLLCILRTEAEVHTDSAEQIWWLKLSQFNGSNRQNSVHSPVNQEHWTVWEMGAF